MEYLVNGCYGIQIFACRTYVDTQMIHTFIPVRSPEQTGREEFNEQR